MHRFQPEIPFGCIATATLLSNSAFGASTRFDGSKVMFGPVVGGGIERLLTNYSTTSTLIISSAIAASPLSLPGMFPPWVQTVRVALTPKFP
jgi:hypothetical protein